MSKYVIIDTETLEKRIEELENKRDSEECSDPRDYSYLCGKIHQIEQVLLCSTPLIPEIEKAFDAGELYGREDMQIAIGRLSDYNSKGLEKQEYTSNLKFDI